MICRNGQFQIKHSQISIHLDILSIQDIVSLSGDLVADANVDVVSVLPCFKKRIEKLNEKLNFKVQDILSCANCG
jgi:hypothetical protein